MKKPAVMATLAISALALAAPAHAAPEPDGTFGSGVNAANNWNFTAGAVCRAEVAVVPVLGDWVGDQVDNCSNGNVVERPQP
ncbi:hypothetical protein ACFY7C_25625 [Streptomyces sp. NPDC012769]|uniref:hypothetical protein n=1 Tax=Streptomyces sp. NPDC012769 TaxID=3364848 RepID=UPI0036BC0271